jgi:hypothetical protein
MSQAGVLTHFIFDVMGLKAWPTQAIGNQTSFHMRRRYNKCGLYREMLTYKPLTNSAVQDYIFLRSRLK